MEEKLPDVEDADVSMAEDVTGGNALSATAETAAGPPVDSSAGRMLLDDHEEAPKEDSTLLDDQEVAPKEDSTHTAAEASPTKTRDEDNESQGRDPHDTPANNAGEPKSRTEKGELDDAAPATKSAQPDARNIALPHRAVNKKVAVVLPEVPARVRELVKELQVELAQLVGKSLLDATEYITIVLIEPDTHRARKEMPASDANGQSADRPTKPKNKRFNSGSYASTSDTDDADADKDHTVPEGSPKLNPVPGSPLKRPHQDDPKDAESNPVPRSPLKRPHQDDPKDAESVDDAKQQRKKMKKDAKKDAKRKEVVGAGAPDTVVKKRGAGGNQKNLADNQIIQIDQVDSIIRAIQNEHGGFLALDDDSPPMAKVLGRMARRAVNIKASRRRTQAVLSLIAGLFSVEAWTAIGSNLENYVIAYRMNETMANPNNPWRLVPDADELRNAGTSTQMVVNQEVKSRVIDPIMEAFGGDELAVEYKLLLSRMEDDLVFRERMRAELDARNIPTLGTRAETDTLNLLTAYACSEAMLASAVHFAKVRETIKNAVHGGNVYNAIKGGLSGPGGIPIAALHPRIKTLMHTVSPKLLRHLLAHARLDDLNVRLDRLHRTLIRCMLPNAIGAPPTWHDAMTLFRVRPADIRAGKYTIRALLDPPDHDRDSVLDKNALDSLPPPTIEEYVPYASLEYIEEDLWATPNLSDNDDKDSASESDEDEDDDVTAVDESQMPDLRDDGDEE